MNVLKAFDELNKLNESAATDELKELLAEITQLDSEIAELQQEKSDSWKNDYESKFEAERKALARCKSDLDDLIRTYRTKYYTEWDDDGDPVDFDYHINTAEQRSVSMIEASIRAKLSQVEAEYNRLKAQAEQDHAAAFAGHTQTIKDKSATRDTRKSHKETLLKTIIEEERPELEELIKKANEHTKATADITKVSFHGGKLYLDLTSEEDEIEIDLWSDIDYYSDQCYVKIDTLVGEAEDRALEDGFLFDVAYGLGFDDDAIDAIDFTFGDTYGAVDIPGSSWQLLTGCDLEYNEPSAWVNRYDETEVDEDFKYTITCYLVKEI